MSEQWAIVSNETVLWIWLIVSNIGWLVAYVFRTRTKRRTSVSMYLGEGKSISVEGYSARETVALMQLARGPK